MGRKIPAKKHRGVKDPFVQQAKRLQSLKGKINAPPRDPDEQPVPRSLLRLFAPPRPARADRPPRPAESRGRGGGRGGALSRLRRGAGESAREFSLRINSAVRALHGPDTLDYPVEEADDAGDARGERMQRLREGRQRKRRAAAAKGGAAGAGAAGAAGAGDEPRPTRSQRRSLKLKEKKQKVDLAASAQAAAGPLYEHVPFGEQAHAPPRLAPPRLPRPAPAPPASAPLAPAADKDPSAARRWGGLLLAGGGAGAREAARLAAVEAYRALNKARRQQPARPRRD